MREETSRKTETRKRVLRVAASEMRSRGLTAVGLTDVMQRARLTYGGFYTHFSLKDALVAASLEQTFAQGEAKVWRVTYGKPAKVASGDYFDTYFSEAHRDQRGDRVSHRGPKPGTRVTRLEGSLCVQPRLGHIARTVRTSVVSRQCPSWYTYKLARARLLDHHRDVRCRCTVPDRAASKNILAAAHHAVPTRAGLLALPARSYSVEQ